MLKSFKYAFGRHITNCVGWRTKRKIVVFESDDWGSIRMPSNIVYSILKSKGVVGGSFYAKYDTFASDEDWEKLFSTLSNFKDSIGNPPVITTNFIVANPDFEKIRKSDFSGYYYESFVETVKRYKGSEKYMGLVREGIASGLIYPQLHGREHFNVARWMMKLKERDLDFLTAFDNRTFFVGKKESHFKGKSIFAALDFDKKKEIYDHEKILNDAAATFEKIFQLKSVSFVAPNYIWAPEHERILKNIGVKYIQVTKYQNVPQQNNNYKRLFRYMGKTNLYGQVNIVRNCFFEPSSSKSKNTVNSCLNDIEAAFFQKKPAVISVHRLNFIGALNSANRSENLQLFQELLAGIVKRWPEVEFMSTPQLGDLIAEQRV